MNENLNRIPGIENDIRDYLNAYKKWAKTKEVLDKKGIIAEPWEHPRDLKHIADYFCTIQVHDPYFLKLVSKIYDAKIHTFPQEYRNKDYIGVAVAAEGVLVYIAFATEEELAVINGV